MAVSNQLRPGLTDRTRVKIVTVDPSTRRIEAALKDGSLIQIAVWDVPHAFRWPKETEIWIVRRDNGVWMLDRRVQQGQVSVSSSTNGNFGGNGIFSSPSGLFGVTSGDAPSFQATVEPEPAPLEQMQPGQMKLDSDIVIDASGRTFVALDLTGIQHGWTLHWDATLNRFVAGP